MAATKRLKDVPGFTPGWKIINEGKTLEGDWLAESQFGSVQSAVVMREDGTANFDRPAYRESPNVNIIAYGCKKKTWLRKGEVKVAIIRQPRPHADDPERPGNDHKPVVFGSVPMGFMEKLIGETGEKAARREAREEAGASAVIRVTRPEYPWHNPNPTFVSTWSDLYFVEVDLNKIEKLKEDRNEPIYSAEYVPVAVLLQRIAVGKDSKGAVYRMCTTNSLLMIFFATHPELWEY